MARFILALFVSICFFSTNNPAKGQAKEPFAVVELFTSEGCSSCPAADELLKQMVVSGENEGKPFIALAFHITYWNHLGWVDNYSKELFTERQKKYAEILKQQNIYTPQAIVNGEHQFVGSNAIAFRDTLKKVEKRKPTYRIEANAKQRGDSIEVQYVLNKESKNQVINIAIIEKNSEHIIARGENKNRTLKHFNVVREFKTLESKKQDTVKFHAIQDLDIGNMEVVLYVQNKKTMKIGGASKIAVSE
jgi:hypothetical protein